MIPGNPEAANAKLDCPCFLVDLGIDGRLLKTTALGEERPLDAAGTREAAAKNRRAELVPTGTGPGVASGTTK